VDAWYHARSAARKWGGSEETYLPLEQFIDSSKEGSVTDVRHRALLHHAEGVRICLRVFGPTLTVPRERGSIEVPVRQIAERHILEDIGWLPTFSQYVEGLPIKMWMSGSQRRTVPLSHLLLKAPGEAA
jgi:hypothetical protein